MNQLPQPMRETDLERTERLMKEREITGTIRPSTVTSPLFPDHRCWNVYLRWPRQKTTMRAGFFTPYAWEDAAPTLAFVLNTWIIEAQHIVDGSSYEVWGDEHGYDTDDNKVDQIYRRAQRQADQLIEFLGHDLDLFLYGTQPAQQSDL
jgi:hypothetical protein